MLIINEELLAIDQAIECLVSYFLKLPEVENYRLKRQKFENDRELQEQLLADNSGQPIEKVHADAERDNWMSAQETLEYGFIDEIMANNQLK